MGSKSLNSSWSFGRSTRSPSSLWPICLALVLHIIKDCSGQLVDCDHVEQFANELLHCPFALGGLTAKPDSKVMLKLDHNRAR
jgi:hypothetical protein